MDPALSVDDLATDLGLTPATVTGYLRTGRIPGGFQPVDNARWRVDADIYRAWRAERRAAVDPHRIEPRSARSKAAQSRRRGK